MALPEFEQRETLEALDTIAKPAGLHIGSRTVVLERLGGLTNRNYKVTLGPTEESVEAAVYVLGIPSRYIRFYALSWQKISLDLHENLREISLNSSM